jgi:integrase
MVVDGYGTAHCMDSWRSGQWGKPIHVTLNATALEVLNKQLGKHTALLFTYYGKPVTQVNAKAWRAALKRAGIENFRWHDFRHTWASWLTQQGVPLNVIQEIGAWESPEMVRRYAHVAPEQFATHARVVDALVNKQLRTQLRHNRSEAEKKKGLAVSLTL